MLVTRLVAGLTSVARELARLPQYAEEAERLHRAMRRAASDEAKVGQIEAQAGRGYRGSAILAGREVDIAGGALPPP